METKTLIVNWKNIGECVYQNYNYTDEDVEAFMEQARYFAKKLDLDFDTIRNHARPAFFISTDGYYADDEYRDEAEHYFEKICEQL